MPHSIFYPNNSLFQPNNFSDVFTSGPVFFKKCTLLGYFLIFPLSAHTVGSNSYLVPPPVFSKCPTPYLSLGGLCIFNCNWESSVRLEPCDGTSIHERSRRPDLNRKQNVRKVPRFLIGRWDCSPFTLPRRRTEWESIREQRTALSRWNSLLCSLIG